MNYFLLKLRFSTPLHCGESGSARSLDTSQMTISADTVFSALCHAALNSDGVKGIDRLYRAAVNNKLKISDMLPYSEDTLYLPRPIIASDQRRRQDPADRKKLKKFKYIPFDKLPSYISYLHGKEDFDFDDVKDTFGDSYVQDKAVLREKDESVPYSVGLYRFDAGCGLYVIIGYEEADLADKITALLRNVGIGGIGGKVSTSYGKFELLDNPGLQSEIVRNSLVPMLESTASRSYILLTTALPKKEELEKAMEGSFYSVVRRGGFVQSETYFQSPLKKQTQYFFAAGSVFTNRFEGDVFDVSINAGHPVYRYAKPLFLGVNL